MITSQLPTHLPHDREGKSTLVHKLLLLSGQLGRIPPLALLPLWIGCALFAGLLWGRDWLLVAVTVAVGTLFDGLSLALLPRRSRSWGPVTPPLLGLTALRAGLVAAIGLLADPGNPAMLVQLLAQVTLSAIAVYATWIEPFAVRITRQELVVPGWRAGPTLRLLHISDLHFEGHSPREATVLAAVERLRPDVIVLTGDYLSLSSVYDPATQAGACEVLQALRAPLGVFAITGSPPVDVPGIVPEVFAGVPVQWLENAHTTLTWGENRLLVLGVCCTTNDATDSAVLRQLWATTSPQHPVLLLYHTPDIMPTAAELGVTLYLAGHTHGGQLSLPFYGALVTSSKWGKRYEAGRYQAGATTLYVSRGLGLEGLGAPRARFCAPPEIILWELRGEIQDSAGLLVTGQVPADPC